MDNELLQMGLRIINRYNSMEKKARTYGTDVMLYPSEIHVIEAIGSSGGSTTTKLANILGITKGGISQTCSKLMQKGLIEKSDGEGLNELIISLTEKGRTAYFGHQKLHKELIEKMNALSSGIDGTTMSTIRAILTAINDELTRLEEEK